MTVKISAKDMRISPEIEKSIEKKISAHLKKYKQHDADDFILTVKIVEKKPFTRVDIDMPYLHYHIHAEAETTDGILTGIDRCVDIIDKQIEKYKTRMHKTRYRGKSEVRTPEVSEDDASELSADETGYNIVRVENFELKPMSIEEAVLQMEVLDNKFLVFRNTESDSMSVIYKRTDGNIGLIEP